MGNHRITLLYSLLFCRFGIDAFNLDIAESRVLEFTNNDSPSLFGYSVGLRKGSNNSMVVVGAPMKTGTGGEHVGGSYTCDTKSKICTELPQATVNSDSTSQETQGMSISTVEDFVVVTSPRYYQSIPTKYYRGRISVYSGDMSSPYSSEPCRDEAYGNLNYGYCLAGMSSSATTLNDDTIFVIGTPGALNLRGSLITLRRGKRDGTSISDTVFKTTQDRLKIDYIMGYSVSVGTFSNRADGDYLIDMVGGAPRGGERMQGVVIIYKLLFNGRNSQIFVLENPDDQVGSYFGASVLAVDINGDGKDDLLIGSPRHTSLSQDEGKVYVYLHRTEEEFTGLDSNNQLNGENQATAQFGTSITNIGDINNDGFNDVAIGAPQGGPGNKGAVYIYNGDQTGIRRKYSQVIYASSFTNGGSGFGFSIAGGVDVDGNQYSDILVGAYRDSKAYLIKSKPVIKLTSNLRTSVGAVPTNISSQYRCNIGTNTYNCIDLLVDLSYTGVGTPDQLLFEITLKFDTRFVVGQKRAFTFDGKLPEKTMNVTLQRGASKTFNVTTAVSLSVTANVIDPINFEATYKEHIDQSKCTDSPCPILDQLTEMSNSKEITYLKACRSEITCEPNLSVTSELGLPDNKDENTIIYGRVFKVAYKARVENTGEAAYQSNMKLNFTSDLDFSSIRVNNKRIVNDGTTDLTGNLKQLSVPLANPIAANSYVDVVVEFSVSRTRPTSEEYIFSIEVDAFGTDTNITDNRNTKSIKTKVETCVRLQAHARPALIQYEENISAPPAPTNNSYNDSVKVDVIGTEVIYTIFVQNSGSLPVEGMEVLVEAVVEKNNLDFIYVVHMEVDGSVCSENDLNNLKYRSPFENYASGNSSNNNEENKRRRRRRDTAAVNCRTGSCKPYTCKITNIDGNKAATLTMYTRMWNHNLAKIAVRNVQMDVSVTFVGPTKDTYVQGSDCETKQIVTLELNQRVQEKDGKPIAWWIILLAVLGALILLALSIAILYRVGFFKRKLKGKSITGPTDGNEATNPTVDDYDDDDDE